MECGVEGRAAQSTGSILKDIHQNFADTSNAYG
jgi:hypothetical protein